MNNATRWALVTFACGIAATIIGKYIVEDGMAAGVALSFLFAIIGWMAIEGEKLP